MSLVSNLYSCTHKLQKQKLLVEGVRCKRNYVKKSLLVVRIQFNACWNSGVRLQAPDATRSSIIFRHEHACHRQVGQRPREGVLPARAPAQKGGVRVGREPQHSAREALLADSVIPSTKIDPSRALPLGLSPFTQSSRAAATPPQ